MKLHFVSFFGLAPSTEKQKHNFGDQSDLINRQKCLHDSAVEYGDVDVVHAWSRDRLLKTDYYEINKALLDQPRGCGYWAWKPYIILQTLAQTQPGDYVIYCDVGKPNEHSMIDHGNVITGSLLPLIDWADRHSGMLPGVYLSNHGAAKNWIKRDCFQLMDCDQEPFHFMPTVQAGYTVWKNTPDVIAFLEEWQNLNTDDRLITDKANTLGLDNYDGFVRHCHDQATLTLLCEKKKVTVFGGRKSQFWGFRNINYIALEAAYQNAEFDKKLTLNALNNKCGLLPKYLVRWLELLMLNRREQQLKCAIFGDYSKQQKQAWSHYFPNASFDYFSNDVMDLTGLYDCVLAIQLHTQKFDNAMLANIYRSLNDEGVMFLAPLPKPASELELSAREISNKGVFNDVVEFSQFQQPVYSPKVPNSRNPIFLSGKNVDTGINESTCLMVKPRSINSMYAKYLEAS